MIALGLWHYWICVGLMMVGLYILIDSNNLVKKMMGLNIFQVSVIMFYVSMAKVSAGPHPLFPNMWKRCFTPTRCPMF